MRRKKIRITDEISPDVATCEHCGEQIFWDEVAYVHRNGMSPCGVKLEAGTPAQIGGVPVTVNPKIVTDDAVTTNAEPTTWYEDVDPERWPSTNARGLSHH